ncbi:hypothetical protein [Mesorhizobium sp. M0058]|uniref:hypothetical protein n=1 Tax=Mesorhizobium sp. M0058 TaxID=2956865 RepID=UPI003338A689
MAEHLPNAMTDDPAAVSDLADEMMKSAEREGIGADEINEEVGSVFEVILEAMKNRPAARVDDTMPRSKWFWIVVGVLTALIVLALVMSLTLTALGSH